MKTFFLLPLFVAAILLGSCSTNNVVSHSETTSNNTNNNSSSSSNESIGFNTNAVKADLVVFDGKKVEKTDEEWKTLLTQKQYEVLRRKGTEIACSASDMLKNKKKGVFYCAGCGLALFRSTTKFDSGTGWPSFWEPYHAKNVGKLEDNSHGMQRTEVICNRCGGHLGHVFDDGPEPSGLRYCINGAALQFEEER